MEQEKKKSVYPLFLQQPMNSFNANGTKQVNRVGKKLQVGDDALCRKTSPNREKKKIDDIQREEDVSLW